MMRTRALLSLRLRRGLATATSAAAKNSWGVSLQPIPGFTPPRSIVDTILGRSTMRPVKLTEPAITVPARTEISVSQDVKVTRLANGVKVATREFQTPVASVGVFVNTGSRDESAENAGISHFLETAAFATTRTRTDFRLIRDTSRMGATLSVSAGRECIGYTGEVLANWTRPVLETLGDLVKRPMFIDFELRDLVHHYREAVEEREHKHDVNLLEHVHGAAYGYSTLGSPLLAPLDNLKNFKRPEVLKAFWSQNFTADRISVVAVGVPHNYAVELAEQEFAELEAGSSKREAAKYVGGDVRMHASPFVHSAFDHHNTHIALAWEGASWSSPDALAYGVLSALLGTDKAFATNAPSATRAVQTRLNSRVIAQGLAHNASSFTSLFSDSGLFGVYAACKPGDASNAAHAVLAEVQSLTGSISAEELNRAKLAVKHSILYSLDSRSTLLNTIGQQLATTDAVVSPKAWAEAVDKISAADLNRVAQKLLKTPLTVAASGDLTKLPRYDQLAAKL